MPFDPAEHHRRSIRRPGYDYAASGWYFVTICAQNRSCLFGDVVGGQLRPNDAGHMVMDEWHALPDRFPDVELDRAILMPNHLHGIVVIHRTLRRGEPCVRPPQVRGTADGSLGRVLQAFKSLTTTRYIDGVKTAEWRRFSCHLWQRDYFDHIIRNDWSLDRIRWYIDTNPERWDRDAENPNGSGVDDVRAWVHALGQERQRGQDAVEDDRAGSAIPREGEHEVRPYGAIRSQSTGGRTQGSPLRIGHGFDLHRLLAGPRLMLGGVAVSDDVRADAHSDGDVVLHAIVDALLGAMGLGDIGEHFPNDDPRWKDAPSRVFVETAYAKVRAAGYVVGNVDVTILAERPKLKPFKPAMVESIAGMLQTSPDRVNVKAGTNEGVDAVGRGEAVAAHAVVLLLAAGD